jgi:hypothetical protein
MKLGGGPALGEILPAEGRVKDEVMWGSCPGRNFVRGYSVVGKGRWFMLDAVLVFGLVAADAFKCLGGGRGAMRAYSGNCENYSPTSLKFGFTLINLLLIIVTRWKFFSPSVA